VVSAAENKPFEDHVSEPLLDRAVAMSFFEVLPYAGDIYSE
jgi:hypothetical protein